MKTKIFIALTLIVIVIATAYAQNLSSGSAELPDVVKNWEQMAEKGDTAALHRLLEFYDENAPVYLEVEEVIEVDDDGEWVAVTDTASVDSVVPGLDAEVEALYNERLDYWLSKGLSMNDPVATYKKGMRMYYTDEQQALTYLSQVAGNGNSQAAMFCGSAYYNQGQIDKAIKYQTIAYNAHVPSAGWHLAMWMAAQGDYADMEKAIKYMRHSAMLNYPEQFLK